MSQTRLGRRSDWVKSAGFTNVIGAGSFGVVLKANDKSDWTAPSFAVKIIFPGYPTDPYLKDQERDKILREAKTLIGKQHQNIVTTTAFAEEPLGHQDFKKIFKRLELEGQAHDLVAIWRSKATKGQLDTIWIQMELCGHNLRSWFNKIMHTDPELHTVQVGIIQDLVGGLKYLHLNKILHRDFKPENIYFTRDYLLPVKIGDFGLSREVSDDICLTSKVGTSDYRAPEANSRDYSYQADLYSLGLVIWEVTQLISGKERKSLFDRLVNDKQESLVHDHPVITNCKTVIIRLTKKTVEERTQSVQQITLDLQNFSITNLQKLWQKFEIGNDNDLTYKRIESTSLTLEDVNIRVTNPKELKQRQSTAVKAGGMRITQNESHLKKKKTDRRRSPVKMDFYAEDFYTALKVSTSPPKSVTTVVSGALQKGNAYFPKEAVQSFHDKPLPTHDRGAPTKPVVLHQPRKQFD